MKKNVGIIFGGKSSEYYVSLESAYSVLLEIDKEKYNPVLIGISQEGNWYYYQGNIQKIKENNWCNENDCCNALLSLNATKSTLVIINEEGVHEINIDVIFPILHGKNGEDGTIQGYIQLTGIPLVGCDVLSSALCMDKYRSHMLVEKAGISCARGKVFDKNEKSCIATFCDEVGYPCFIKPVHAGSSFGVSKVNDYSQLDDAICKAFKYDKQIIVEEFIDGFEVGCAILGNDPYIIGEIDEIECSNNFFDFDEKYTLKNSVVHVPARISASKSQQCKEIALEIYKILGCRGFARVDCFINSKNDIIFNEVNTIPGFTAHSRFPTMLEKVGISFKEIISLAIEEAR